VTRVTRTDALDSQRRAFIIDGVDCGKIFNPFTAALLVTYGFLTAFRGSAWPRRG
jgi:hypothetical protein